MKLDSVDGQRAMTHRHHLALGAGRRDLELVGDGDRRERVVAAGLELFRQAVEDAAAVVTDGARLAVDQPLCRPDLAAEGLDDGLVPRQTPSVGTVGASRVTISTVKPASRGRPGPGEMTSRLGASRTALSASIASFLITLTSQPSAPNRCARLYVNES